MVNTELSTGKEILREKFSSEPDKYYRVALFNELGYERKKCPLCQRYFWTLDHNRTNCPEQPCQNYEFIGKPPTPKKYSYIQTWRMIQDYFERNGHTFVPRYPVVCRWRPDLYFTVASIVDFQRLEGGKVVFELPVNPLIVPQMCLRFSDIANVGITGRHYTSFCMIGQTAIANSQGYWKDRCIELDFELLTKVFGIPKEEVIFKEDVWLGPGAFGNSLEYHVRGLELGNAVFTGFEGTPTDYKESQQKVIDMGAGLNRFTWISNGTFNSYESVFPEVLSKMRASLGLGVDDSPTMQDYYSIAGSLDVDDLRGKPIDYDRIARDLNTDPIRLRQSVKNAQALYSIADHLRTLVFAISDGALPSNVGGGYNLRVILRRSLDFLEFLKADLKLEDVASWHIDHLKNLYPELAEHRDDVATILSVEEKKYSISKDRTGKIVESLAKKKTPVSEEKLIELYDSEGITPEALARAGLDVRIPTDFYAKITEKHMAEKQEEEVAVSFDVTGLAPTELIFYLNRDQFEFKATVERIIDNQYVVLDKTAFYARSGGQEPDHGTINGVPVIEVIKYHNIVLHKLDGEASKAFQVNSTVNGRVNGRRRSLVMRHHTATHIINGACRKLIGPWVWQHSAFKDEDMGRLDITHFAHLTRDQVLEIERMANEVVRRNLPVIVKWIPRGQAEKEYGFRLYQGGVVPLKELRIVNIEGWDVEACGGTHCSSTGEVGLIKITKSERVQDGVERLEFVAGEAAVNYFEKLESILLEEAKLLETPIDKIVASLGNVMKNEANARRAAKNLGKQLADVQDSLASEKSKRISDGVKLYLSATTDEWLDGDYHVLLGDKVTKSDPSIVYVALFAENNRFRIIVFCGQEAQNAGVRAGNLSREIASKIGGSGGGDGRFAQGGAPVIPERIPDVEPILLNLISSSRKPK